MYNNQMYLLNYRTPKSMQFHLCAGRAVISIVVESDIVAYFLTWVPHDHAMTHHTCNVWF